MFAKLLVLCCLQYLVSCELDVISQWAELQFVFPSEKAKQTAIEKEYYIQDPLSNVPIDVDVDYSKNYRRLFITIPRFDKGRPVTLGTLDDQSRVVPYPDYSWHDNQGENCNGFTSVFRVYIDKCQRLWVLDSGKIGEDFPCPPQVVAFDLKTDKVIYRHKFVKNTSYFDSSLYITLIADVRDLYCSDFKNTFIYAADVDGHGLGVVDVRADKSWRIEHQSFSPNSDETFFDIAGEQFELPDGLFALALSPLVFNDRKLYYHALASSSEYYVKTSVIRNNRFISNPQLPDYSVTKLAGQRTNQSASEAMDDRGIMYFSILNKINIVCWDSKTEYKTENFNVIDMNYTTLQFPSGLKVVTNPKGRKELWLLTSRFQKVMTETMNAGEINFRILSGPLPDVCC